MERKEYKMNNPAIWIWDSYNFRLWCDDDLLAIVSDGGDA